MGILASHEAPMAKLVVLSESQKGLSHELKAEKTTVGRLDDNAFQIPEQSVSSHHCEITLRGSEVVIKDLNSTNGTYINGEQITEKVLKPGQTLRLGTIDLRLDDGSVPADKPSQASSRTQGGVKFTNTVPISPVFDKNSPFAKKTNKVGVIFITIGIVLFVLIVVLVVLAISQMKS